MLRTTLALCLAFTVIAASAQAEYREVHNLSIDAASLSQFVVDVGAGDLEISGDANATAVTVVATIIVEGVSDSRAQEFVKNHVKVELFRKGEKGQLNSIIGSRNTSWLSRMLSGSMSVRADLVVVVPHNIALDIDDGSGHMLLERLSQSVKIDDDSGDIKIKHIAGALSIKDDSGHIDARSIQGPLNIDDDSGDVILEDVNGDVYIEDDSGHITIDQLTGALEIDDDSGDIEIDNAVGALTISDDSGHIDIRHLAGVVTIEDDSGDVRAKHVEGNMSVHDKSGHIIISQLIGSVEVSDDSGDIDLDEISQDVIILRNGSGSLRLGTVGGAIRMR